MITVNIEIIDHQFSYETELQCLPSKGDAFMFDVDDDNDPLNTVVEEIAHWHSDEEGHVIWVTLKQLEADK